MAERVLCLSGVCALGAVAQAAAEDESERDDALEFQDDVLRWLAGSSLIGPMTTAEQALVAKQLHEWSDDDRLGAASATEALGVLLWALGEYDELPPEGEQFAAVADDAPLFDDVAAYAEAAVVRPRAQLDAAHAAASSAERRRALDWLCGARSSWD